MYPDNTLEITGVQVDDSGLYSCLASSNSGETSQSATLLVIGMFIVYSHTCKPMYYPFEFSVMRCLYLKIHLVKVHTI